MRSTVLALEVYAVKNS